MFNFLFSKTLPPLLKALAEAAAVAITLNATNDVYSAIKRKINDEGS